MNSEFMEFAQSESDALKPTNWDRWIDAAEDLFGGDLDGDEELDGYSMDGAYTAFEKGYTVGEYVRQVYAKQETIANSFRVD